MTTPTQPTNPTPHSPSASFSWAAAWLLVAVLGFVALGVNWQGLIGSELSGQRTVGVVVFMPILSTAISIMLMVRGIVAVGRTRTYHARFSADVRAQFESERLRGQPSTPFLVFAAILGVIWLAGTVVVLIFLNMLIGSPDGLALALMLLALLAMSGVASLRTGLSRRAAR